MCEKKLFLLQKSKEWPTKTQFFISNMSFLAQKFVFLQKMLFLLAIPCFSITETYIFAPLCSSPFRIVTNLYTINIEFYQLFSTPSFYMAEPQISIFGLCPPYRILTTPYSLKIGPPCGRDFSPTLFRKCPALSYDVII